MTAPSKDQIEKIESITVIPGDRIEDPIELQINFKPGSFEQALRFALWLSEVTGIQAKAWAPEWEADGGDLRVIKRA